MKQIVISCECDNPTCSFYLQYDDECKLFYPTVYLVEYKSFWRRLKVGIKYIFFGSSSVDIHGAVWSKESTEKLAKFITENLND